MHSQLSKMWWQIMLLGASPMRPPVNGAASRPVTAVVKTPLSDGSTAEGTYQSFIR